MRVIRRDDASVEAATRHERDAARERLRLLRRERRLTSRDFTDEYRSDIIREHLHRTQHEKCCYCEKELELRFQHVDHYRPKSTARRSASTVDEGYWWLAYDLDNLLLSCPDCNTCKSDWFPLEQGSTPGNEQDCCNSEIPSLLNPLLDDPQEHLVFILLPNGRWRLAPLSERGRSTIEHLKLNRDTLVRLRNKLSRQADALRIGATAGAREAFCSEENSFTLLREALMREVPAVDTGDV